MQLRPDVALMGVLDDLSADVDHAIRLNADLEYFAAQMLKIRPKAGALAPFLFNPAQRELDRQLEEQKAKTGRVRAIVLKARQMGISTYIAARFYKQTTSNPGLRTAIIAHEKPAVKNLFSLVKRFHEHMPEEAASIHGRIERRRADLRQHRFRLSGFGCDGRGQRPIRDGAATARLRGCVLGIAPGAACGADANHS